MKKVILSPKDETPMFVFGVNHMKYQKEMNIVSIRHTTNCMFNIKGCQSKLILTDL